MKWLELCAKVCILSVTYSLWFYSIAIWLCYSTVFCLLASDNVVGIYLHFQNLLPITKTFHIKMDTGSSTQGDSCIDGSVRLNGSDGEGVREGRVEVCVNRAWGTVCDDRFSQGDFQGDAEVVCGTLGGFHREGKRINDVQTHVYMCIKVLPLKR